jgi:hypothetical protein
MMHLSSDIPRAGLYVFVQRNARLSTFISSFVGGNEIHEQNENELQWQYHISIVSF